MTSLLSDTPTPLTDAPTSAADRTSLEAEVADFDLDGQGIGNIAALREADDLYARNAVWFHHPSYVAHLNCPVAVPAVAAAAIARTTLDGTPWLKLTLLNPDTTVADITAVLDLVRATGHGILADRNLESTSLEGGAA